LLRFIRFYTSAYQGLTTPAWMLALVLLINRTGTMVLPFLSLYLKEELNFSLAQIGTILSVFGAGSLVGSFLGGWLTDRLGSFYVQTGALVGGGIGFLILSFMDSFEGLLTGIFLVTVVTDSIRPANSTAVAEYAKPENLTKAYSLNRMAVNLGFSIGPAIGGFLAAIDYTLIFYVDGISCILAGIVYAIYFRSIPKRKPKMNEESKPTLPSRRIPTPWRDGPFLVFLCMVAGYGIVFFQLFNTLPLYYRDIYVLSESKIGWLLALNGFVVFLVEMPVVHALGKTFPVKRVVTSGAVLAGLALLILNLYQGIAILILSMILLSLSEILAMPFMTTYTVERADPRSRGRYLGMYSVGYSMAFIAAPALGTFLIDEFNYTVLWYFMGVFSLFVALGLLNGMKPLLSRE